MVNEATQLLTSIFNEGRKGFSAKCLSCLGNPRRKRREYDCEQEGVVATCVFVWFGGRGGCCQARQGLFFYINPNCIR
jgi:hypothetical protein